MVMVERAENVSGDAVSALVLAQEQTEKAI